VEEILKKDEVKKDENLVDEVENTEELFDDAEKLINDMLNM
jgi:hypothetical protein